MPYLHWETDRKRERVSHLLDMETERHRKVKQEAEYQQKKERQTERRGLVIPRHGGQTKNDPKKVESNIHVDQIAQTIVRSASGGVTAKMQQYTRLKKYFKSTIFNTDESGRVITTSEIGQLLFDAAMLYEAMAMYRDKMFFQEYLHKEPPLHPRRTLDQAYYWTLKTTKSRDRDQVVYRGTRPDPKHSIQPITGHWNCSEMSRSAAEDPQQEAQQSESGEDEPDEIHCTHCRSHIQKVSRLLMVDQLWMWILDKQTIITAFPRRYGVNKQDPSGIHKSIRSRLKNLRQGHIKTVFDLALIILDECSNMFFDRTKTAVRPSKPGDSPKQNAPLFHLTYTDLDSKGSTTTGA